MSNLFISVIIPTFNEEQNLKVLLPFIESTALQGHFEIVVADGGSTDASQAFVEEQGYVWLPCIRKGRAHQLNAGAARAKGDILYFVHADVRLHKDWYRDLIESIEMGYDLGCYRYVFDGGPALLKINALFTRLDKIWCRGGDQTLFITREKFDYLGGYDENHLIMEDYDIIIRARKSMKFRIIPKNITVSSRKYEQNGYFKVLKANYTIMRGYFKGEDQQELANKYRQMLNYR